MVDDNKLVYNKKKVLVINTKYKNFGGEDSNIVEELKLLKTKYLVEYLEFDNNANLNFSTLFSFIFAVNPSSNLRLKKIIERFNPDVAYIHNTWYRANLGLFNILEKNNIDIFLKLHNYRFDCSKNFLIKNHLQDNIFCKKCGLNKLNNKFINKYFQESYMKSIALIIYGKKYFKILKNKKITLIVLNNFQKKFLKKINIQTPTTILSNPIINFEKNISFDKSNKNDVVYAGLISDSKGLRELLDSWLLAETKNLKLKIIGTGPMKEILEDTYKSKNIEFLNVKSNKETLEIIQNSKAVITATKMFEVQPRLLSEASSLGVASIFPNFGGMTEFFPNDYPLSFVQYDYKTLVDKIQMLHDNNFVEIQSENVYNFVKQNLSDKKFLREFDKIFFDNLPI